MFKISLHQANYIDNGVAGLTIPFTNKLSKFIILLLKVNTIYVKVHQKIKCLNLQTFRRHCHISAN